MALSSEPWKLRRSLVGPAHSSSRLQTTFYLFCNAVLFPDLSLGLGRFGRTEAATRPPFSSIFFLNHSDLLTFAGAPESKS